MYKAIQEDAPCWIEDANEKRIVPFDTTEVIYNGCPTTMYLISSRPNQKFTVTVDCADYLNFCTPAYPEIQAILTVDGTDVGWLVTHREIDSCELTFEGVYDGDKALRPFRFEKLQMAAEGLQPADAVARGLGTVKVSLRRALLRKPKGQTDDLSLKRLHQAYDEKKVKMKLAHVTDLDSKCEVEAANETWDLKLHPQDDTHPFQCFLFRHNSEAVWQAAGVLKDEKTRRFGQSQRPGSEKNPIIIPDDDDDNVI